MKPTLKIPLASATTASILYILCVILTNIGGVKDIMLKYMNVTMHGIDINAIWAPHISAGGFIAGVIATFITWLVIGWVFTYMLGVFAKK